MPRTESEACAALWEKVLQVAVGDGDLPWLHHQVEDAGMVGSFTWVAISLGAEPTHLLDGIDYQDDLNPVFPRSSDGSVILWDWTDHDATEERIEERDAARGGDEDVAGPEAPDVECPRIRRCDWRPQWYEDRRQDSCGVGA